MLSEAQRFWDAIVGKVRKTASEEAKNAFRCERYEVTTAPNGSKIGVTLPMGSREIFLPYSKEVSSATVGTPVLVVWWGSMSNAKVYFFANGYNGPTTSDIGAVSTSDVQYKIYDSIADLPGFSSTDVGSATIAGAYSAMSAGNILICNAGAFSSDEVPNTTGVVTIVKSLASYRAWIDFHGRYAANGDYRMFLNSEDKPTGTWYETPAGVFTGSFTATTGSIDTSTSVLARYGKVVTATLNVTSVDIGTSWTKYAEIPTGYRPMHNLVVPGLAGYTPVQIYISTAGNISARASSALTGQAVRISETWLAA